MKTKIILSVILFYSFSAFAVISDHEDIDMLDSFPQSTMNAVGQQKWLFTHASVGGNMIDGMNDLNLLNPTRYQLDTSAVGYTGSGSTQRANDPPATTITGTVYECQRGNPGWADKLHCFSNSVTVSGWNKENDKVDFAMDKFCYIDPTANTNTYIETMNNLAAAYPQTKIVWMTIPLTTGTGGGDQDARNDFNKFIRIYCAENNINLLDIADIEAYDTNNIDYTYIYNGHTNQTMWSAYTSDDGHLNTLGRQRVAKGWYAMAAQNVIPEPFYLSFIIFQLLFIISRRK